MEMALLKTKYTTTEVADDDVLHLVVPMKFTRARIVSKPEKSSADTRKRHQVQYWDGRGVRGVSFATIPEAEAFLGTVTVNHDVLRDVTVAEAMKHAQCFQKFYRLAPQRVDYPARDVPLDAWILGSWIGDGISLKCAITTADDEIRDAWSKLAESIGFRLAYDGRFIYSVVPKEGDVAHRKTPHKEHITAALDALRDGMQTNQVIKDYKVSWLSLQKFKNLRGEGKFEEYFANRKRNPVSEALKTLGVWGNKHVPDLYLKNSREVRLQVLAGIIDTDGHMAGGGYNIEFATKRLTEDVVTLATSLGFICSNIVKEKSGYSVKGEMLTSYRTRVMGGPELMDIPCILPRRQVHSKTQRFDQLEFTLTPVSE